MVVIAFICSDQNTPILRTSLHLFPMSQFRYISPKPSSPKILRYNKNCLVPFFLLNLIFFWHSLNTTVLVFSAFYILLVFFHNKKQKTVIKHILNTYLFADWATCGHGASIISSRAWISLCHLLTIFSPLASITDLKPTNNK